MTELSRLLAEAEPTRLLLERFLLELLHFAGWRLEIRRGSSTRIRAARSGVVLDVTGPSLSHSAGTLFARAMRSSRDTGRSGGT